MEMEKIKTEDKSQEELNELKTIIENVTNCEVKDIYCKKQKLETVPVQNGYMLEIKVIINDKEKTIKMISYKNNITLKWCLQEACGWIIKERNKTLKNREMIQYGE